METFHSLVGDGPDDIHVCFYQMWNILSPQLQKYIFLNMSIKCGAFALKQLFKLYVTQ